MDLTFCGGAGEVGASCYLLTIDGKNLLLDCGIRMGSDKDTLPDLGVIQERGGVDAILVSHAHLDHTGCLPAISREYPHAVIYMTHATKDLVRVLLYDSLKIMHSNEAEIPVYAQAHVRDMLNRVVCYSPEFEFTPFKDSRIRVTFYSAGHVAGAAAVYIKGNEGSLLYTGDFSSKRQATIEGSSISNRLRPDAMIIETTYGDKLHANRQVEEQRLVEMVEQIVGNRGKILIPAFALGRAQEVILILKSAFNKRKLSPFKVYVDGMVREICRMYQLNPNYLRNSLARKVFKGRDIFFDDNIIAIEDREQREEVTEQRDGCCIISSSGMLTGGPSQWYAERLAPDEKNFIAITGYQDEESPGCHLLSLLDGHSDQDDKVLKLGDRMVPVRCGIGKYNLSAHGDRGEILGLIHGLAPKQVFMVHGDLSVIEDIAQRVQKEIRGQVHVAQNGQTFEVNISRPRKQLSRPDIPPLNKELPLGPEDIKELWRHVFDNGVTFRALSPEELLKIWTGSSQLGDEEIHEFNRLLNESIYFDPDRKRPFLFHAVEPDVVEERMKPKIMELNQMLALADEFFPPDTGLYKKGARFEQGIVLLSFKFPKVAMERYDQRFKEFEELTGWKVEVSQEYNLESLDMEITKLLPDDVTLEKASYYRIEGYFRIAVRGSIDQDRIKERFKAITGLDLVIDDADVQTIANCDGIKTDPQQMEQNKALNLIEDAFKDMEDKLYKKSVKQQSGCRYIELSFISPQIGGKYKDIIEKLENQTRWAIRINKIPNQNEIIKLIKIITEDKGISLKKNPSIHQMEEVIRIIPVDHVDQQVIEELCREVMDRTGYVLEVRI
ncbi:MAG: MBL fold metallo-hydrolase [Mahellales bacterium]|jgi:predicted metal-dependent RNase